MVTGLFIISAAIETTFIQMPWGRFGRRGRQARRALRRFGQARKPFESLIVSAGWLRVGVPPSWPCRSSTRPVARARPGFFILARCLGKKAKNRERLRT
jgi:hypothetical protein